MGGINIRSPLFLCAPVLASIPYISILNDVSAGDSNRKRGNENAIQIHDILYHIP